MSNTLFVNLCFFRQNIGIKVFFIDPDTDICNA